MALSFRGKGLLIVAALSLLSAILTVGSTGLGSGVLNSIALTLGFYKPPPERHTALVEPGQPAPNSPETVDATEAPSDPDPDLTLPAVSEENISTPNPARADRHSQTAIENKPISEGEPDVEPTLTFENNAPVAAGFAAPTMARQGQTPDGRLWKRLDPFRSPIKVRPDEGRAVKSRKSFDGNLRNLVSKPKKDRVRFPNERVLPNPQNFGARRDDKDPRIEEPPHSGIAPGATAPAPAPINTFEALGRTGGWGNGYPPDPTGDVGPNHYVQAINTALAIYDKTGTLLAGPMNLDTFMSQGNFGNLCDTDNFGDPVVLYDTFEDRWIVSDFAFTLSGSTVVNPPGSFQCIAVSKTGDPVSGGWNFYSINRTDALNDYPKLGVWPDGIYMSANMFDFSSGGFYRGVTVWALNKAQMYAGNPNVQIVSFDIGTGDFSLLPANARLQTGTPPPGTPNYFVSTWNFLNALSVYKFSVDWNRISLSTFTGPEIPLAATSWPNNEVSSAAVPMDGTSLDTVQIRAMMQNTYSRIGGSESLWLPHTVRRANTSGAAAPRWYQINVTGGSVASNLLQASTWDPDGNNSIHRYMPSLTVDRAGNLAMGYTASGSALHPSIRYAGRLSSDPINTFSLTEQTMFAGTGSQTSTSRWGDYTHMTLDPDGCTFWFTNQYYAATGTLYRTRVGNFKFDECTVVGSGTLSGIVTSNGVPLPDATVSLGSRSATTGPDGSFAFHDLPAGLYSEVNAAKPGFDADAVNSIVVNEGAITTQNFSLASAPESGCLPDTSQSQFQNGIPENVVLTTGGEVTLSNDPVLDQQNLDLLVGSGFSFTTAWHAQTFTAAVTGPLKRLDLHLYSADCSEVTMPSITMSIRAASGNLPTGPDLAVTTIPGFCTGTSRYYTANFAAPATINAGTQYAIVWRSTLTGVSIDGNPRYISTISDGNPYSGGRRATSTNNGSSWTGAGSANNDFGFRIYVDTGFAPSGSLISEIKDANPAADSLPVWGNLTWTNAALPTGTNILFHAAASRSPAGPFNFVGPDGTSGTFFENGGSLSQFDGQRYLRYKALLSTTNAANTPTLNDVNVCFDNQAAAACAEVSMPGRSSMTGVPLAVPVNVSDLAGMVARSADFTITFDPDVIEPDGNSANNWGVTLGTVGTSNGGGRTMTVSRPSPGTLSVSLFGTNDLEGAGALVDLNFNVVGDPTGTTAVSFTSFIFNEGDPCAAATNGSVTVIPGSISGKVTYGNTGTAPFPKAVPNVTITAAGSSPASDTTANDGTYNLSDMGAGQYTVTPSKTGEVQNAISGFDAADIAAHAVGVLQLTTNQLIVADVSGNGTVTSFDAALVASFVAQLPDAGSTGTWRFLPASTVYPNLNTDHTGQDYVALLMGDVTGNWNPPPPPAASIAQLHEDPQALAISAPRLNAAPGTALKVPVTIGDITGLGIRSYEFELHYDANVLEPAAVAADTAGRISEGRTVTVNSLEKGILRVVIFGALPLEGQGHLLDLHFNVVGTVDSASELRWEHFRLNEGGIGFEVNNGLVNIAASADSGTINGRLLDPQGGGISRTLVTVTDTRGNQRTVVTSTLGFFQISGLSIGETYTVRAESRRYRFAPQAISIAPGNAIQLEIIALE